MHKKMRVMKKFAFGELQFAEGTEVEVTDRPKDRGKFIIMEITPEQARLAGLSPNPGSISDTINLAAFVQSGHLCEIVMSR